MQVDAIEAGLRLGQGRIQRAEVSDTVGAPRSLENQLVKLDDFAKRQVAQHAKRRYSSSFLRRTRSATAWKSSSRIQPLT